MRNRQSGFTLIEILVVVAIIGALMGLVVILIPKAQRKNREMLTRNLVTNLQLRVETYYQEMKRYPPMTVKDLTAAAEAWKGFTVDNGTNESIECLYVALHHPDLSPGARLGDDIETGNTDEDIWSQPVPGTGSPGSPDAKEVLDSWGNPFIYISKSHYDKPVEVVTKDGTITVSAAKKKDGTFYNPLTFQIISLGEDGKQDEDSEDGDDISNFNVER